MQYRGARSADLRADGAYGKTFAHDFDWNPSVLAEVPRGDVLTDCTDKVHEFPFGTPDSTVSDLVSQLMRISDAEGALAIWHGTASPPQVIGVESLDALDIEALITEHGNAPPGDPRVCTVARRDHENCNRLTIAIPLKGGAVEITLLLPAAHPDRNVSGQCVLTTLLPVLKTFFQQWIAMQHLMSWNDDLVAAINTTNRAMMIVNRSTEIRYVNEAARILINQYDGLRESSGCIACSSLSDTLRLRTAIEHVLEDAGKRSEINPILSLERTDRRPLFLVVTAARHAQRSVFVDPFAIVHVFDPEQDLTKVVEPACQIYGLSQSETRLTCALVDGHSLSSAASRLRLREQTARSYLKQVFTKTGTNRQAELVQLMLKSAIRITSSTPTQTFCN